MMHLHPKAVSLVYGLCMGNDFEGMYLPPINACS